MTILSAVSRILPPENEAITLLELAAFETRIGNLVIGCRPLRSVRTKRGSIAVEIDEMLGDTAIEVT